MPRWAAVAVLEWNAQAYAYAEMTMWMQADVMGAAAKLDRQDYPGRRQRRAAASGFS
jgi:hypothetical protein